MLKQLKYELASFPRIRGDVPKQVRALIGGNHVFPAYAGMFLEGFAHVVDAGGFPRIRGDVPDYRNETHI